MCRLLNFSHCQKKCKEPFKEVCIYIYKEPFKNVYIYIYIYKKRKKKKYKYIKIDKKE